MLLLSYHKIKNTNDCCQLSWWCSRMHFYTLIGWYYYYYYHNHFTTLCPGLPRWVGTSRINHSGFCWSRDDGEAAASAEPYASYLHLASEDNHASTSPVRFLWARCPSWHPTNSKFITRNQNFDKRLHRHCQRKFTLESDSNCSSLAL